MDSSSEPVDPGAALEAALEPDIGDSALRRRLAAYGALVLEANRRFNVTAARTPEAVAGQIRDSLTVVPYVCEPYVDVGSGGGFPAIPVALATGIAPTLIEATAKKARLLASLLAELGLAGRIVAERAEAAARRPELRERFASGTCRAVGSGPAAAELLLGLIGVGGCAILQRGTESAQESAALEDAALVLGARLESDDAIADNRRIVVLRKTSGTPQRFPRRNGLPQKRPLCLEERGRR